MIYPWVSDEIIFQKKMLTTNLVSFYDASMLTNRDLQRLFSKSLVQVKRWAMAALGPDPEAPQGGGVSRLYNNDEVFIIFLYGKVFIKELGMNSEEAMGHINAIKPILFAEGLLPSKIDFTKWFMPPRVKKRFEAFSLTNKDFHSILAINLIVLSNNLYSIEWKIKCLFHPNSSEKDGFDSTTFSYEKIFPDALIPSETKPLYRISLLGEIKEFNNLIK
jgi:hypothetical protein